MKSGKGKTTIKARRREPRSKRGINAEEGPSGRRSEEAVKKLRRGVTDGTLPTALKYGPIAGRYSSDKASTCLHPAISELSDCELPNCLRICWQCTGPMYGCVRLTLLRPRYHARILAKLHAP